MIDPLASGIHSVQAGHLEQARRLLARAVADNPCSAEAWLWLGRALQDADKQRYCFNKSLELKPGDPETIVELAFLDQPGTFAPQPVSFRDPYRIENQPPVPPAPAARPVSPSAAPDPAQEETHSARPILVILAEDRFFNVLVGLLIGLVILGLPITNLIHAGTLDANIPGLQPPITAAPTGLARQTQTLLAAPAVLSTFTPTPTYVKTASAKNTPTAGLDPLPTAGGSTSDQVDVLFAQSRFDAAIPLLDQIIAADPGSGQAYARRGQAYYTLVDRSPSYRIDEYRDLLTRAIADLDTAIRLGPPLADSYYYRAAAYAALADGSDYRVDREKLDKIALENLQAALASGTQIPAAQVDLVELLAQNGRCGEALDAAGKLSDTASSAADRARLDDGLSASYLCLGKLQDAADWKQSAIDQEETCERDTDLALIQYNLGQADRALRTVNRCIQASPGSGGMRYYLRALIEYTYKQAALARQDLDIGMDNTWFTGGIHAYVLGKLALDAGDNQTGIKLLREAEATMMLREGPAVLSQVRNDLAYLGIVRLLPTAAVRFQGTPLSLAVFTPTATPAAPAAPASTPSAAPATLTPTATPSPTGTPVPRIPPPGSIEATRVDVSVGLGNFTLQPNETRLFHFQPAAPIKNQAITSLTLYLDCTPDSSTAPFEVQMWVPGRDWFELLGSRGETRLDEMPAILPDGDLYAQLVNLSGVPVQIDYLGFAIVVRQSDGSIRMYGSGPGPLIGGLP